MENAIYNHLMICEYEVKIANIEEYSKNKDNKTIINTVEIDFVATKDDKKYYIQSCYQISSEEKFEKEIRGLKKMSDYTKRIMVLNGDFEPYIDEYNIYYISITDFLLKTEW